MDLILVKYSVPNDPLHNGFNVFLKIHDYIRSCTIRFERLRTTGGIGQAFISFEEIDSFTLEKCVIKTLKYPKVLQQISMIELVNHSKAIWDSKLSRYLDFVDCFFLTTTPSPNLL